MPVKEEPKNPLRSFLNGTARVVKDPAVALFVTNTCFMVATDNWPAACLQASIGLYAARAAAKGEEGVSLDALSLVNGLSFASAVTVGDSWQMAAALGMWGVGNKLHAINIRQNIHNPQLLKRHSMYYSCGSIAATSSAPVIDPVAMCFNVAGLARSTFLSEDWLTFKEGSRAAKISEHITTERVLATGFAITTAKLGVGAETYKDALMTLGFGSMTWGYGNMNKPENEELYEYIKKIPQKIKASLSFNDQDYTPS